MKVKLTREIVTGLAAEFAADNLKEFVEVDAELVAEPEADAPVEPTPEVEPAAEPSTDAPAETDVP